MTTYVVLNGDELIKEFASREVAEDFCRRMNEDKRWPDRQDCRVEERESE